MSVNLCPSSGVNNSDIVNKPKINCSELEAGFVFDNCQEIHIGPRYETSHNVIINQLSGTKEDIEIVLKDLSPEIKYNSEFSGSFSSINEFLSKQYNRIILVIGLLTFLAVIALIIQNKYHNEFSSDRENQFLKETYSFAGIQENSDDYPLNKLFVPREAWGAEQPLNELFDNTLPLKRVIFIHTVSSGTCNNNKACRQKVQDIQYFHRNIQKYGDIGYNFVIGSDGFIYIGLGWNKIGSHTLGYNTGSLGVAFIGNFMRDEPNELMLTAAKRLLGFGVEIKKLSEDYQLFAHCQTLSHFPLSPGKNILRQIKMWDHWNSTNINQCIQAE